MKAIWILNGGIEKEWGGCFKKLDSYGLQEYLDMKQKYVGGYQKSLKQKK